MASGVPEHRHPGEINGHEVLMRVGRGSFGEVWIARELLTSVRRAIKVVFKDDPELAVWDLEGVKRFQRAATNHPYLMQIFAVNENANCYYYLMEAADNATAHLVDEYAPLTLEKLIRRKGRFSPLEALTMIRELADGVECLNRHGLSHNDLKPDNVLIVGGQPKIADFGLLTEVNRSIRAGAMNYRTPQGHADDRFALGIMLKVMLGSPAAMDLLHPLPPSLAEDRSLIAPAMARIMNRATADRPEERYSSTRELLDEVEAALTLVDAPWPRLLRSQVKRRLALLPRWMMVALVAGVVVLGCHLVTIAVIRLVLGDTNASLSSPGTTNPVVTGTEPIELIDLTRWRHTPEEIDPNRPLYPGVSFPETALSSPGLYVYRLDAPAEHFIVDFHLRFRRATGRVALAVSSKEDGADALRALFCSQPDGLGLRLMFDSFVDGTERVVHEDPIVGHPQSGVEYVLRMTRSETSVFLGLWPLVRGSIRPLVRRLENVDCPSEARYVTIDAGSPDALAWMEVLDITVHRLEGPVEGVDSVQSPWVTGRAMPAHLPSPLRDSAMSPWGNLLAEPFHPYASDAWMAIGNWMWWSSASPDSILKEIRCTPFSSQERGIHRSPAFYEGLQLLRFDRGRYGDFSARFAVRLADRDSGRFDPFVSESHDGAFGLAFRLQDDAPERCGWGGGFLAKISLSSAGRVSGVDLSRFEGLTMGGNGDGFSIAMLNPVSLPNRAARVSVPITFGDVMVLEVLASGSHFIMSLDDRVVLEADETETDYPPMGKVALFASRLIATFESLEVTTIEDDNPPAIP